MRRRRRQRSSANDFYDPPSAALEADAESPNKIALMPFVLRIVLLTCLINQVVGPVIYLFFNEVLFSNVQRIGVTFTQSYFVLLVFDWFFIAPFCLFLLAILVPRRNLAYSTLHRPVILALYSGLFAIVFILGLTTLFEVIIKSGIRINAMISLLAGVTFPAMLSGWVIARFRHRTGLTEG